MTFPTGLKLYSTFNADHAESDANLDSSFRFELDDGYHTYYTRYGAVSFPTVAAGVSLVSGGPYGGNCLSVKADAASSQRYARYGPSEKYVDGLLDGVGSLSTWISPAYNGTPGYDIRFVTVSLGQTSAAGMGRSVSLYHRASDGAFVVRLYDNAGVPVPTYLTFPFDPTADEWYHIKVSLDYPNSIMCLWLNGVSQVIDTAADAGGQVLLQYVHFGWFDEVGSTVKSHARIGETILRSDVSWFDFTPPTDYTDITTVMDAYWPGTFLGTDHGDPLGRPESETVPLPSLFVFIDPVIKKFGAGSLGAANAAPALKQLVFENPRVDEITQIGTFSFHFTLPYAGAATNSLLCVYADPTNKNNVIHVYQDVLVLYADIYSNVGVLISSLSFAFNPAAFTWYWLKYMFDLTAGDNKIALDAALKDTDVLTGTRGAGKFLCAGACPSDPLAGEMTTWWIDELESYNVLHGAIGDPVPIAELDFTPTKPVISAGAPSVVTQGQAGVTFDISSGLDADVVSLNAGGSCVGVSALSNFINNADGTGSVDVDFDPLLDNYVVAFEAVGVLGDISPESDTKAVKTYPAAPTLLYNGATVYRNDANIVIDLSSLANDIAALALGPSTQGVASLHDFWNYGTPAYTGECQIDLTPGAHEIIVTVIATDGDAISSPESEILRISALPVTPVLTRVTTGPLQIITAGDALNLSLLNLDVDILNIVLDDSSVGMDEISDFVNNGDGTGSFSVSTLSVGYLFVLVVRAISNPYSSLPSTPYYLYVQSLSTDIQVDIMSIAPVRSVHSDVYDAMIGGIPPSQTINLWQQYTVPYIAAATRFLLKVPAPPANILITCYRYGKIQGDYDLEKRLVAADNYTYVDIRLGAGTNYIEVKNLDTGETTRLHVASTNFATILHVVATMFHSEVVVGLEDQALDIASTLTTRLADPLLPPQMSAPSSSLDHLGSILGRLLVKGMFHQPGRQGGVSGFAAGLTLNTPYFHSTENVAGRLEPKAYPLYKSQEAFGGVDTHTWLMDPCVARWLAFVRYINNMDCFSVVSISEDEILFYDDSGQLRRHVFDFDAAQCSFGNYLLYDSCGADYPIDTEVASYLDMILCTGAYPFDYVYTSSILMPDWGIIAACAGADNDVSWQSKLGYGGLRRIRYVEPTSISQPLSVSVDRGDVTVSLGTGSYGGGFGVGPFGCAPFGGVGITSTANEVRAAVAAHSLASAMIIGIIAEGTGTGIVAPLGYQILGPFGIIAQCVGAANDVLWRFVPTRIRYVDPSAPSQPLTVAVTGGDVTVSLETDVGANIVSTGNDVIDGVAASSAAAALLFGVAAEGDGTGVVTALGWQTLRYLDPEHEGWIGWSIVSRFDSGSGLDSAGPNPYKASWEPFLVAEHTEPYILNAKTLTIRVHFIAGGFSDETVTFVGADPLPADNAVVEILGAFVYCVAGTDIWGRVWIRPALDHIVSSLKVLNCTAAPIFGWVAGHTVTSGIDVVPCVYDGIQINTAGVDSADIDIDASPDGTVMADLSCGYGVGAFGSAPFGT